MKNFFSYILLSFCSLSFGVLSRLAGQAVPEPQARLFRSRPAGLPLVAVKLEKSREKSPLKKFFSHTFRLLIYGKQPHPPTPSPNREGEKVPLCEERDLG